MIEPLHFAAQQRLPASVSAASREAHVTEVLDLMELTSLAHRRVGHSLASFLSTGQLTRLTIDANLSLLFCDELTSGLDPRSSMILCA